MVVKVMRLTDFIMKIHVISLIHLAWIPTIDKAIKILLLIL